MLKIYIGAGVLIGLGLLIKTFYPTIKGHVGEFKVNLGLRLFLDKDTYHLLKNVTLPAGEGTTQIDQVIVSRYGIFVVETKNMTGMIFGREKEPYWTQKVYRGPTRKFQNPLRQNYKHTATLGEALGIPAEKVFSVVVFAGDARFKTEMPSNVVQDGEIIRFIKSKTEEVFSKAEVAQVLAAIEERRVTPTIGAQREHVRHVKEIVAGKEKRPEHSNTRSSKPGSRSFKSRRRST